MSEIIHKNKASAISACNEFGKRVNNLMEELGVWEENQDSECDIYLYAKYYNEQGEIEKHNHF